MRKRWTDAEDERLYALSGVFPAVTIAAQLTTEFGRPITARAVSQRSRRLRLDPSMAHGDMTIADVAREIGIPQATIGTFLRLRKLKTTGRGKFRFVPPDVVDLLRRKFPAEREPMISTTEAGERLGYTFAGIIYQIKIGKIRASRYGRLWRVPIAEVDRLIGERARAA